MDCIFFFTIIMLKYFLIILNINILPKNWTGAKVIRFA